MGFVFNNNTTHVSSTSTVFVEVTKPEVKIAPPKVVYKTEISNLPRLKLILMAAIGRSHPEHKNEIKIEFSTGACLVHFRGMNKQKDLFALADVKKTRIAVK